jgi:hypothetical protein
MAIDVAARDDLIDALNDEIGAEDPDAAFDAWARSLLALNQINSEVQAEIYEILLNIDPGE